MGILDRHEMVVFASRGTHSRVAGALPEAVSGKIRWRILRSSDLGPLSRLYAEHVTLPRLARREGLDCLFCPGNLVPAGVTVPSVVLFQNAAPFCESVTLHSVGFRYWLRFRLLGALMRSSARRAASVIFISAYFRDLFVRLYGFDSRRGAVVHRARASDQGPREADPAAEERFGIRRPYVLVVSHVNPYKNLVEVVEAFDRARRKTGLSSLTLVIVGRRNHAAYYRKLVATVSRLGLSDSDVRLVGEVAHADVQKLIAGCELYVFPSTCENCPTALIEALDQGAPVACSSTGVMPEIAGDAVVYFDPDDVEDVSRALALLLTDEDLRRRLRAAARERAATFPDGPQVARETIAILEAAGRCAAS